MKPSVKEARKRFVPIITVRKSKKISPVLQQTLKCQCSCGRCCIISGVLVWKQLKSHGAHSSHTTQLFRHDEQVRRSWIFCTPIPLVLRINLSR